MIKNGRPYSIENGSEDAGLITDKSRESAETAMRWIKVHILPASDVLENRTSYGIKHKLQRDTGLYLTNNEFKDAMLLSGFEPVNPNELNWHYRILIADEVNRNESPFFKWVLENYLGKDNPKGDFADDIAHDFAFPAVADRKILLSYLAHCGACADAVETFEELWREYKRQTK